MLSDFTLPDNNLSEWQQQRILKNETSVYLELFVFWSYGSEKQAIAESRNAPSTNGT